MTENNVSENVMRKNPKKRTSSEPKVSVAVKRLWRAHCQDNKKPMSLKVFAKSIASSEPLVSEWFNHKKGSLEKVAKAARLKNKGARISLEKQASKLARRKSKAGSGKPAA